MKIGQLCFFKLSSAAENPYGSAVNQSRYQDQRGPTPSRSYLNFHRTDIAKADKVAKADNADDAAKADEAAVSGNAAD
jgi:dCTP deaminase